MNRKARHTKRPHLLSEQRRQALLDAAHSLFVSKGYAAVSVDEIVRAAGGSKSAVYQFFGGKEGLLAAVTESLAAKMLSEMDIGRSSGMSIRDSLYTLGLKLIGLILSEDGITQFRLAINNLTVDPSLSRLWYTRGPESTFRGLARYLKKEVDAGRLRIKDCQRAADLFLGMLICKDIFTMSIGAGAPTPKQMRHIVSEAVDLFLCAYGT
jgi:TetR/AcrR family transcriptional repressor of mexJK operon